MTGQVLQPPYHRPVYLWAGPGTIRMNRLKFMGARVDEEVHREAHMETGVARIAEEAAFSWAYLTYNWGFPPEVEEEDHDDFRRAVPLFHKAGVKVFGYIQTSNCVYDGSYREKDWYARDRKGRKIHYYTGRYMTCWEHPEWRAHLRRTAGEVIAAGADGVFFDNPWHGFPSLWVGGVWLGTAGCCCPRCRDAFRRETGLEIPVVMKPESDEASRLYLKWRAGRVTAVLAELAEHCRQINPEIVVSANNFDAVTRNSYVMLGMDLETLARVQDVIMIEHYGLPRWEAGEGLLMNGALAIRTARALAGKTPLSLDPYDQGIGFDGVYPARRFQQGIFEAAAGGASMVVKGTEYVEEGQFTLLTAGRFREQRLAIGKAHRWLEERAALFSADRENVAPVGLLYPGERLWQDWARVAPAFFGAGQVLLTEGIPWRVLRPGDDLSNLEFLLTFSGETPGGTCPRALRIIDVPSLPGWRRKTTFLQRHPGLRKAAAWICVGGFRAYFDSGLARRLFDALGVAQGNMSSPFFILPGPEQRQALLEHLVPRPYPRVEAEAPVLVELWKQGEQLQIHLVNYAPTPQKIHLRCQARQLCQLPDNSDIIEQELELLLNLYTIILVPGTSTLSTFLEF